MSETIKAVKISPSTQTISEVELDKADTLHEMYRLIECDYVDVVRGCFSDYPSKTNDDLWVDDEALLKDSPVMWGFRCGLLQKPIVGNALILGVDEETGDCKSHSLTKEDMDLLRHEIEWCYLVNHCPA